MKLRIALTASAATIALMSASSAQADNLYLSLFGGISTFDDELRLRQSRSTSSVIANHFLSQTTRGSGVFTTNFKTGYSTLTPTYVGPPTYTTLTYTYITIFSTARTIGFYKTIGNVFGSTTNQQYSSFRWNDDFDNGFVIGGAFGVDFSDGWRAELEVAYRSADVDGGGRFRRANTGVLSQFSSVASATKYNYRYAYSTSQTTTATWGVGVGTVTGTTTVFIGSTYSLGPYKGGFTTTPLTGATTGAFTSNGQAETWSIMANLWYDYDLGNNFYAIAGGGVGAAHLNLEYNAAMPTYFGGTATYALDDSGWGFAYQLGAGLGYELGGGIMLSAQYRYFASSEIDVASTELAVESHNFLVGLTIPLGGN